MMEYNFEMNLYYTYFEIRNKLFLNKNNLKG